ncbi:MAG TPA: hypothetical protein VGR62_13435 [Candidatus Binatia bacterium]|jgi:hypothetical protein|nr:hypothetical protein [Candidatus Binatia bacterium]
MQCVGVGDDAPHGSVFRTIAMDGDVLDCLVKLPAKMICRAAVAYSPGDPSPPEPSSDEWLCYAVRCPREITARRMSDEFGAHDVRGDRSKLYCTPGTPME